MYAAARLDAYSECLLMLSGDSAPQARARSIDPPIRLRQSKPTSWLELTIKEGKKAATARCDV